jgi:hypothetical protein
VRHTASGINIDLTFGRLSFEQAAIEHCEIHDIGGLRVRLPRMEDLLIMEPEGAAGRDRESADNRSPAGEIYGG